VTNKRRLGQIIFCPERRFLLSRNPKWVAKWVSKKKRTLIFNESAFFLLVEAMGVEPMSEKSSA
jgi:hypothetical protein